MTDSETTNQDYNIDFERIKELISLFEQKKNSGEIRKYKEEDTKKDFILPLFEALGWNVYNRGKKNDSISAEETISKKRVDYGFRINGVPKFFLEAKSLKEDNIHNNPNYVTQAIDYAWMKSCSWAILTNFETIAVYNADWKESNYGNNLFFVLHPNDFLNDSRFAYLSKIAFENEELDKIASKYGKKQLKNPINKQLLLDMIHFREVLSKDIVRNNQDKHLAQEDIDESVQRILDRLIFIRNAEDRGLEENQLQSNVRQWYSRGKGHLLKEISRVYKDYDDKYNSKLFAHHLCDDLYIENEALQEVIEGLNQSKDNSYRYDFSVIESDVLGNIYEQYLGNILKSTPKRAKLEESKTHRKEQGIYYTPSYIVDYIVKNTVGEYIKTHTLEEIKKVRILDPACGSGSFLIRAYKELENYWKQNSDFAQLTLDSEEFYSKKVEILKNNIFGVDLDPKAVEIAQLNLLLQISEKGEKLPLLQNNIKVGNSLIDDPSISNKAFKWEDQFPEIMNEGGFDVVIGNPPYINLANIKEEEVREFFQNNYETADNKSDTYAFFTERVSKNLLKDGGYFGFIVSSTWTNLKSFVNMRKILLNNFIIYSLAPLQNGTFQVANVEPIIFIVKKEKDKQKIRNNHLAILTYSNNKFVKTKDIPQSVYMDSPNYIINFDWTPEIDRIFKKLKSNTIPLGTYIEFVRGTKTSNNDKFLLPTKKDNHCKPVLRGRDIQRYRIIDPHLFLWYVPEEMKKRVGSVPQNPKLYEIDKKIILQGRSGKKIIATIDDNGYYCIDTTYVSKIKDLKELDLNYFLALLNSKLINYWYGLQFKTSTISGYELDQVPIKAVDAKIKNVYEQIIKLVNDILVLNKKLEGIQLETDKKLKLKDQIKKIDNEINQCVYNIYEITEQEKKIIEESLK